MSAEDCKQIENIIYDYSIYLDRGDFDSLCGLLQKCELTVQLTQSETRSMRGSEIREWIDDNVILYKDGTPRTSHVNSNVRIWLDADSARAHTHLTVLQKVGKAEKRALQPILIGYYEDEFARTGGIWHMTRRTERVVAAGDMSEHGAHVAT